MKNIDNILYDEILPLVVKPGRYVGNEINTLRKDWSKVDVKIALIFPDLYELGMSYLGFEILYHLLNREPYIVAERVFAPWLDLEKILRERDIALFSLETKRPLKDFDLLGFTLQYELHYTNILNILGLGGIPLKREDREDNDPIVFAGGPCSFNPEPVSDFIDAFVIGDGEDVALEVAGLIKKLKQERADRQQILSNLSKISGVYIPQFYAEIEGNFITRIPGENEVPNKIAARNIESLNPDNYPNKPIVPLIETTHDRYAVEIMRGCTRGCRFCNAGSIYRPVRERSVNDIVSQAVSGIKNSGYDEVSLLSLSTSDYSQIQLLLSKLSSTLGERHVNISFPSLRAETFTRDVAKYAKAVRKSGITLAPEAGTEYLRKVINKTNTNDDLLRAVTIAFEEGWKIVKLYFMIGQPGERMEDIEGIVYLIKQVVSIAKKNGGKSIKVSISPFVPKPHTPFQWVRINSIEELQEKISYLRTNIRSDIVKLNWREFEVSLLECILGRGDRRLGKVIQKAYEKGAKFDGWSDQFNFEIWKTAFEECGVNLSDYTSEINLDDKLPWDFIDKGITKGFLKREYQKALAGEETYDCRRTSCNACGLMEHPECQDIIHQNRKKRSKIHDELENQDSSFGRSKRLVKSKVELSVRSVRLKYVKKDSIRFTSHLDTTRIFERAFHRAGIRLAYSQGFNPHPKIAFGPPLTMGYTSEAEYIDVQLFKNRISDLTVLINQKLPAGIEVKDAKILFGKNESLVSIINRADYQIRLHKTYDQSYLETRIAEFSERDEILIQREKKDSIQTLNIKPFIRQISLDTVANTLSLSLYFENGRTARINEILSELLSLNEEEIALAKVKRTGLFIQDGENLLTPLEI